MPYTDPLGPAAPTIAVPATDVISNITQMPNVVENASAFGVILAILFYLFNRLNRLERRMLNVEKSNRRYAILIERIGNAYESARDDLLRVFSALRAGKSLSAPSAEEFDLRHPKLSDLLSRPVDIEDEVN